MDAVLDVQEGRCIGVDVGGTRLKLGVVNAHGAVSAVENIPTPQTRDGLYDAIASFAAAQAEAGPVAGVGMSMPGIIGSYPVLGCVRMPELRRAGCRNNAGMIGAVYRFITDAC